MTSFALIIPAAGVGVRSGSTVPKQYAPINGMPMLAHTLRPFLLRDDCVEIVVAIDPAWRREAEMCGGGDARVRFVEGGTERQHSIARGLAALTTDSPLVLVHDAARPVVGNDLIDRLLDAAVERGAAIPVLPITDTIKQVDDRGDVVGTPARASLRIVQTPQAFRRELLERAYRHAETSGILGTDDASLVESLGEPVATVPGDARTIKVTDPGDFSRVADWLR